MSDHNDTPFHDTPAPAPAAPSNADAAYPAPASPPAATPGEPAPETGAAPAPAAAAPAGSADTSAATHGMVAAGSAAKTGVTRGERGESGQAGDRGEPGERAHGGERDQRRRRGGRGKGGGAGRPADGAQPERQPPAQHQNHTQNKGQRAASRKVHPLLETLAGLYPNLFGARFLPLKRGIYEDLLARHAEVLPGDELKVALGQHARSTRYLDAIANRVPRHNLDGQPVEELAPDHVHHAIVEIFKRRQGRTQEDLRPQLVARLADAIGASGLERLDYVQQVRVSHPDAIALIDEAFTEHGRRLARREALQRAFEASGQPSVEAFAAMYGMDLGEARRVLGRQPKGAAAALGAAAAAAASDANVASEAGAA